MEPVRRTRIVAAPPRWHMPSLLFSVNELGLKSTPYANQRCMTLCRERSSALRVTFCGIFPSRSHVFYGRVSSGEKSARLNKPRDTVSTVEDNSPRIRRPLAPVRRFIVPRLATLFGAAFRLDLAAAAWRFATIRRGQAGDERSLSPSLMELTFGHKKAAPSRGAAWK